MQFSGYRACSYSPRPCKIDSYLCEVATLSFKLIQLIINYIFKVYQHQQPSLLSQHCQAAQESKVGAETYQHHENCANLIVRMMVIGAWLTTLLFSLPQAVIFRVLRHPLVEFYQCTTWGYFENLATRNITQGEPQLHLQIF